MDSLMAETVEEKQWYLAVGDRSIGPLTTALVTRGIQSGKVPLTAWICQVGANSWSALSSFGEFQDVVDHVLAAGVAANQQRDRASSSPPAVSGTQPSAGDLNSGNGSASASTAQPRPAAGEEEDPTGQHSVLPYEQPEPGQLPSFEQEQSVGETDFVTSAASLGSNEPLARQEQPSFPEQSGQREIPPNLNQGGWSLSEAAPTVDHSTQASGSPAAARAAARLTHDDLGIDITFDEDHENAIDWRERFQSYFLVGSEVQLPAEDKLLQSLRETPRAIFMHDEALWNLSLCLAFGSDEVAYTSARTFFEAIAPEQASERIEWICRTLLSKGFMPSGIPRSDGMRGIDLLRGACPAELSEVFEREAVD